MRALVCGAGIAGLTVANRLEAHGWDVTVIDRAPGPREQGYMIDFAGPGYDAVIAMGLERELHAAASTVAQFEYVDRAGRATVSLPYSRFVTALGGGIVSLMRPALERLLRGSLGDRVELRYGQSIDDVQDTADSARVTLTDSTELTADLVVGADGVHSRVRSLVFGADRDDLRYLGMHTAAYVFRDPALLEQVRDRFVLTETLHRQMGFYGIGADQVAVFTVHRTPDRRLPTDPRAELRSRFSGMGELVDAALAHCPDPERVYYDEVTQVRTPRWHRGHVVLVGDAAHAVSLVAGQGASLGTGGAFLLAELLAGDAPAPEALAAFEERWRPVVTQVQDSARDRVLQWFLPTSRWVLLARRWGFRAMQLPGLSSIMVGSLLPKDHVRPAGAAGCRPHHTPR